MTNFSYPLICTGTVFSPVAPHAAQAVGPSIMKRMTIGPHDFDWMCDCDRCALEKTFESPHEQGTPSRRLDYTIWKMQKLLGIEPTVLSDTVPEVTCLKRIEEIVTAYKEIVDITKMVK